MMFALRMTVGLFLFLSTISHVSAKLGALGVLEVFRQDFETVSRFRDVGSQYQIATAAIQMIVMTRLSDSFQRHNYRITGEDHFNNTPEFLHLTEDFDYNKHHFDKDDLYGTPSSELSKAPYQSFGFSSKVATSSQKTCYAKWFSEAVLLKIDVDDILEKAAFLPEITSSLRGRNHLEACRQLWALTISDREKKSQSGVSNPYFDTFTINNNGDSQAYKQPYYDYHGKSPTEELERKQEYQEQEILERLAFGHSIQEIRKALICKDIQRVAWANTSLERAEWVLEVKEQKERQIVAHKKAIQERAREARERAEWKKAFQAKRESEDAEWELETKKRVDQERGQWEEQEWILQERKSLQEDILQERKRVREMCENILGEHTWSKAAEEVIQQTFNEWEDDLQRNILQKRTEWERALQENIKQERAIWKKYRGRYTMIPPWAGSHCEEDSEEEEWSREVRNRQNREAKAQCENKCIQTEREEKRRLQLKEIQRAQVIPGLKAYLDSLPIFTKGGPRSIILRYLSTKDRDNLLPCIPYIQEMRDQLALDRIIPDNFMPLNGESPTPTIALEDWAEKIPGSDGTPLYLFIADHSLLLFNTKGGGSWRGSSKQLERDAPESLTIHLDNGNKAHIQRGVVNNEGETIKRVVLHSKESEKRPDLSTILSPDFLKVIDADFSLLINKVFIDKNKFQYPLPPDYQTEQITDEHTGVKYNMAYPTWKSFVQVDLHPETVFQFSEDQRYLVCTEPNGGKTLLDTLKCRIEDTTYDSNAQQVLIKNPRVRNIISEQGALISLDTITSEELNHTDWRVTDVLNAAFSPSCDSFFVICGTDTPGHYALQEIDAETFVPRPASTAHLPLIPLAGTRQDIIRDGYLKSIDNMLLYFRHDGQVMRWKLGY